MAYVVTENCINCKHTTCVEVCPTDAFKEGPNFLVIDPNSCIDCNLCVSECPIGAIFEEGDVPKNQTHFIKLNADLAQLWPEISRVAEPLHDHEKWNGVEKKLKLLQQWPL